MRGDLQPEPGTVLGVSYATPDGEGGWRDIRESRRLYGLYHPGLEPVEVELVADPDGPLTGWVRSGEDERGPVMVLRSKIFDIQFPYGHEAEEERGKGKAIRLSAREARA